MEASKELKRKLNRTETVSAVIINLYEKDKNGNTPLHIAASKGNLVKVKNLIHYIMNIDSSLIEAKNSFGSSPLHDATWSGQLAIIDYLLKQGADLKTKDIYDQTLMHAAAWNGHLKLVKYFFEKGLSLEEKDQKGKTPLLSAAQNNHFKVVKFLISKGADSAAQDNEGDNIFLIAAKNGYLNIIDYFAREKRIDLSTIKDGDGNTLLHLAVENDHIKLVKYLFYFGKFNLEEKNNDGNTPLDIAVEIEENNLVETLLQLGARIDPVKHEGNVRVHLIHQDKPEELGQYILKENERLSAANAPLPETNPNQEKKKRLKKTRSNLSKPIAMALTTQNDVFGMQSLNTSLNPLVSSTGFFQHHVQAPQSQVSPFNLSSISNIDNGMNGTNSTGAIALAQALFNKPKNQTNKQIERYQQEEQIIRAINSFDTNNFTTKP